MRFWTPPAGVVPSRDRTRTTIATRSCCACAVCELPGHQGHTADPLSPHVQWARRLDFDDFSAMPESCGDSLDRRRSGPNAAQFSPATIWSGLPRAAPGRADNSQWRAWERVQHVSEPFRAPKRRLCRYNAGVSMARMRRLKRWTGWEPAPHASARARGQVRTSRSRVDMFATDVSLGQSENGCNTGMRSCDVHSC